MYSDDVTHVKRFATSEMSRNSRNQQNNGDGRSQYRHRAVDKSHPSPHVEVPPALCSGPSLPAAAASPRMDAEGPRGHCEVPSLSWSVCLFIRQHLHCVKAQLD